MVMYRIDTISFFSSHYNFNYDERIPISILQLALGKYNSVLIQLCPQFLLFVPISNFKAKTIPTQRIILKTPKSEICPSPVLQQTRSMINYIYVYSPFILLPLNPHIFFSSFTHHAGLLVYFKPTPRLMNGRFRFFLK